MHTSHVRRRTAIVAAALPAILVGAAEGGDPGSGAFEYQGQLKQGGVPVSDTCDFEFSLWDRDNDPYSGAQIGSALPSTTAVSDGLFEVELDFGPVAFDGTGRWLQVEVCCPSPCAPAFVALMPRQKVTAAPYALQTRGLFVDEEGQVGIGTRYPSNPLHVEPQGDRSIVGINRDPEGRSVFGLALSDSGVNTGVFGQTTSPEGHGVYGWASATSGFNYGVYGVSWSGDGHGVHGLASSQSGVTYGVWGKNVSEHGAGVYGIAQSSVGGTFGVFGRSTSTLGRGVYGWASAATGTTRGVWGRSESDSGIGVFGQCSAAAGTNYGVYGETASPDGYAGYFTGGRNYFEGNVGIGTDSPTELLEVAGDVRATGAWLEGTPVTNLTLNNSNFGSGSEIEFQFQNAKSAEISSLRDGDFRVGLPQAGEMLRIYEWGGTPSTLIFGWAEGARVAETLTLNTFSTEPTAVGLGGGLGWSVGGRKSARIDVVLTDATNDARRADMVFRLTDPDRSGDQTERMRLTSHGNLGIGTNTPTCRLEVEADSDNALCAMTDGAIGVTGTSTHSSGIGVYGHGTGTTGFNVGVLGEVDSAVGYAGYFRGGRSHFEGNVGIGTETPGAKLELAGSNANIIMHESGGSPFVEIGDNGTDRGYLQWWSPSNRLLLYSSAHDYPVAIGPTATGGLFVDTETNGSNVGIGIEAPQFKLHVNGSAGKPGGGSWSSASDRRLKKNIRKLDGALDRMMRLRGVTFEYKDPKAINELPGERTGMIAQEVEDVFPDWVGVGGHGYKTLTYRGFEALTVESLRELRAEKNRQLREKGLQIEKLQRQVAELENRLARLENLLAEDDARIPYGVEGS